MTNTLNAVKREVKGDSARDARAIKLIPAVIYGRGLGSQALSVPRSDFLHVFKAVGYSSLVDVTIESATPVKALIKEVQVDPLTLEPTHIDFQQVRMDEEITATIPLKFVGESAAVKVDGGTLVKTLDELEVSCLPANLPHDIEVDLSIIKTFEDAITVNDLKLPNGVKIVSEENMTIATVAKPMTEEEFKKLEESGIGDVTTVKTEGEEKKAAEEAAAAEEKKAEEVTKPAK